MCCMVNCPLMKLLYAHATMQVLVKLGQISMEAQAGITGSKELPLLGVSAGIQSFHAQLSCQASPGAVPAQGQEHPVGKAHAARTLKGSITLSQVKVGAQACQAGSVSALAGSKPAVAAQLAQLAVQVRLQPTVAPTEQQAPAAAGSLSCMLESTLAGCMANVQQEGLHGLAQALGAVSAFVAQRKAAKKKRGSREALVRQSSAAPEPAGPTSSTEQSEDSGHAGPGRPGTAAAAQAAETYAEGGLEVSFQLKAKDALVVQVLGAAGVEASQRLELQGLSCAAAAVRGSHQRGHTAEVKLLQVSLSTPDTTPASANAQPLLLLRQTALQLSQPLGPLGAAAADSGGPALRPPQLSVSLKAPQLTLSPSTIAPLIAIAGTLANTAVALKESAAKAHASGGKGSSEGSDAAAAEAAEAFVACGVETGREGADGKGRKKGKVPARLPLLRVEVEDLAVVIQHSAPLVPGCCTMADALAAAGAAATAAASGGSAQQQQAAAGPVQALAAEHRLQVAGARVGADLSAGRMLCQLHSVSLQQQAALGAAAKAGAGAAAQKAGAAAGEKAASYQATPLAIEVLELRLRAPPRAPASAGPSQASTSRNSRGSARPGSGPPGFASIKAEGVRVSAEFDALLTTLGLAQFGADHGAAFARAAQPLLALKAQGRKPVGPALQKPPHAPWIAELLVKDFAARACVGLKDEISASVGYARGSSLLKVR